MLTDVVMGVHATRLHPSEGYFDRCIDSLMAHTRNYRLIVVDDASDEQGRRSIESTLSKCPNSTLLIRTHKQRWFTRAYNLGMRMCRSEWSVICNSDLEFGDGWLEELFDVRDDAARQTGTKVGLVGSVLSIEETRRWAESTIQTRDYVTGHCVLVSIPALFEASNSRGMPGWYLDEIRQDAIHIRSDVYICWDLNNLGWKTIKSFKSAVGHVDGGGKSWGHDIGRVGRLTLVEVND
jgi:glycosyltransferase involved in cell wall biosynthesis